MPKKAVAVRPGDVYLDFRGIYNLVDALRRRIGAGCQSVVDGARFSNSRRRVIELHDFVHATSLCR
jgi:hypothetical protein